MLNTQHLGNYVLTEQLRQDQTGSFHRGLHATSYDPVTIKVLHEKFGKDPDLVARFNRAVEALRQIEHPAIPQVLDHGESPQGLYLVTESLTGEVLSQRLQRERRLPLEETQRIVGTVAAALAAAHRKRVVHRDLTADSIFLVDAGPDGGPAPVKLLDLGLATLADPPVPSGAPPRKGNDKRADILALGRLAYRMLSGEAPVESSADGEGPKRPARLSTHGVTVPASVEAAILKALNRKKKRRFSSMTEFARALGVGIDPAALPAEPEVILTLDDADIDPVEADESVDSMESIETVAADESVESVAAIEPVAAEAVAAAAAVERPIPPPLPAPKPAAPDLAIGLLLHAVPEPGRTARRRAKVAVAAAAFVALLVTGGVLVYRAGDQLRPVAVAPKPAPVAVARAVDVGRAAPVAPPSAPNRVDEILALNQKGVTAYGQGDLKTARDMLLKADDLAVASGYQDAPVRAQTQVRLGALYLAQKRPRLGRSWLVKAVAINPAVRLPAEMMNPQIHKTLIATKQKARLAKSGPAKRGPKSQPTQHAGRDLRKG